MGNSSLKKQFDNCPPTTTHPTKTIKTLLQKAGISSASESLSFSSQLIPHLFQRISAQQSQGHKIVLWIWEALARGGDAGLLSGPCWHPGGTEYFIRKGLFLTHSAEQQLQRAVISLMITHLLGSKANGRICSAKTHVKFNSPQFSQTDHAQQQLTLIQI